MPRSPHPRGSAGHARESLRERMRTVARPRKEIEWLRISPCGRRSVRARDRVVWRRPGAAGPLAKRWSVMRTHETPIAPRERRVRTCIRREERVMRAAQGRCGRSARTSLLRSRPPDRERQPARRRRRSVRRSAASIRGENGRSWSTLESKGTPRCPSPRRHGRRFDPRQRARRRSLPEKPKGRSHGSWASEVSGGSWRRRWPVPSSSRTSGRRESRAQELDALPSRMQVRSADRHPWMVQRTRASSVAVRLSSCSATTRPETSEKRN